MASASNLNLSEVNPGGKKYMVHGVHGIIPETSQPLTGLDLLRDPVQFLEHLDQLDKNMMALISMWRVKAVECEKYAIDEMLTRAMVREDGQELNYMYEGLSGVFRYLNKQPRG
jgi:hypothetical protein